MDRTSIDQSVDGLMPSSVEDGMRRKSDPKDELNSILAYQKVCAASQLAPARSSIPLSAACRWVMLLSHSSTCVPSCLHRWLGLLAGVRPRCGRALVAP